MSLQFRRDSEANITQFNPVLKEGEPLWDLDNKKLYIGDGVTNAVQLDSITGVTDSEVATVLNSLLTEGSSPNVKFVYDTGEDVFNISLDFAIPFDQEIRSTAGFVGSLIGTDGSTVVFNSDDNSFINLGDSFLTDIGPRNDNEFAIGSDEKRFSTGFFHNINVKDQTIVEDVVVNGLIKTDDSSIFFDSRTSTLSANSIFGDLTGDVTGSVFGEDSTLLVDAFGGKIVGDVENINITTDNINGTFIRLAGEIPSEISGGDPVPAGLLITTEKTQEDPFDFFSLVGANDTEDGPAVLLTRTRGTIDNPLVSQDDDNILSIYWLGGKEDGTTEVTAGISGYVDGTPTATFVPGRIEISTTNSSGELNVALSLDKDGVIGIRDNSLTVGSDPGQVDINGTVKYIKITVDGVEYALPVYPLNS